MMLEKIQFCDHTTIIGASPSEPHTGKMYAIHSSAK